MADFRRKEFKKDLIDIKNFNTKNTQVVQILKNLKEIFIKENFTQENLKNYTGKQVVRYTHLFPDDDILLLNHIFSENNKLLLLYQIFLLDLYVEISELKAVIKEELIYKFIELEIFEKSINDKVRSKISITPLGDCYFINEGHSEFEPLHIHQVSRSQNFVFEVFNLLKKNVKIFKNDKILDYCNGSGALGMCVSSSNSEINGIDLNPRAVEFSKLNALLNSKSSNYVEGNANKGWINNEKFDLIVSNPPFHGMIDNDPLNYEKSRLVVHAGDFGDSSTREILSRLDSNLNEDGNSIIVANWLLKENCLAYPNFQELSNNGTLILFHDPIVKSTTWEGLRLLYWADKLEQIPKGYYNKLLKSANFDSVCFGVVCWLKNKGPGGFHLIQNAVERDIGIISNWAEYSLNKILKSS